MKRILVVEDSGFFGKMIMDQLKAEIGFEGLWVKSMAEAVSAIDEQEKPFFASIVDFNLPDAAEGQVIDIVIEHGIPAIVFTGNLSNSVRESVWSKNVVDYALKDDPQSLDYIITMLRRLEKNATIKVLVVDDSLFFRKIVTDLLKIHRYITFNAGNGRDALDVIDRHPDIRMVITDYNMPVMDGFTLTQKIREKYSRNELAVIGVSSEGDQVMAARFIKNGANDFLVKQTFLTEEFYCRVTQSVENLENFQMVKDAAVRDFLTDLYNRRYFFDVGAKYFAGALRENLTLVCAMLDIDHFKKVNDSHGHDAGDLVLQQVSAILKKRMRETDIVARMGGEEFCILVVNIAVEDARKLLEELRAEVEKTAVDVGTGKQIHVTVSIGATAFRTSSLDEMINRADSLLYKAKNSGRNRIIMDDEADNEIDDETKDCR